MTNTVAFGLGIGMLVGIVQATILLGLDGLTLLFLVVAVALLYAGRKAVLR